MTKFIATLALAALLASPALAHNNQHRLLWPGPAGTTWHDAWSWGSPPVRTGAVALAQDGQHYVAVDSYDVVLDGRIVGRDPDPNIRFQLLRAAGLPD